MGCPMNDVEGSQPGVRRPVGDADSVGLAWGVRRRASASVSGPGVCPLRASACSVGSGKRKKGRENK